MKNIHIYINRLLRVGLLLLLFSCESIAQSSCPVCPANLSFENGNFSNWTGRYGNYVFPIPTPVANPAFKYQPTGTGTPAPRYEIMSGNGKDPNINVLPVKAPCGGNYSVRIGYTGSPENQGSGNWPYYESLTYTLLVTPQTTGFTYMYAAVLVDGSHDKFTQPEFDVIMSTCADSTILPCGQYSIYAGNGSSQFHNVGNFQYTDWTAVTTDLSNYIGQQVCITFRVRDCMGNLSSSNGQYSAVSGGGHQGYAYLDAYCAPTAKLDYPEFCIGTGTLEICAPAGYKSYSWPAGQPGLAGSPTTQCVTINNPAEGTKYTVNMMSFSGCPVTITIPIQSIPTTNSADTVHSCPGEPDTLSIKATGNSGPYTYAWSHGLGSATSVLVKPTVTTTYTVTVTNGKNCSSKKYFTVIVDPCNRALQLDGSSICKGDSVLLVPVIKGAVTPYSYSWQPGGYASSTLTVHPSSTTIYTLTVKDAAGFIMTDTAMVIVRPAPVITVNSDTICAGQIASFTAYGADTYTWPAGFTTTGSNSATITPTGNATYVLTGTSDHCPDSALFSVTVKASPHIKANNATICTGDTAQLIASGATTYSWYPTLGLNSATGATVLAYPFTTTTYILTGISNNCPDTAMITVSVNALPDVVVNSPQICAGETTVLIANGAATYTWSPGTTYLAPDKVRVAPLTTTTYTVTGDKAGCKDSAIATVIVHPAPIPDFNGPFEGCTPLTVAFINSSTNSTGYLWNFGDGSNSLLENPVHLYNQPGSFNVSLIAKNAGCQDTLSKPAVVIVYPASTAILKVDKNVVFESSPKVLFTDQSIHAQNCWLDFGDGSPIKEDCDFILEHVYAANKTYCAILLTESDHQCKDTTKVCIEVKPETTFYVPNCFTLNDDGKNEIFKAYGTNITEFQMQIFNRWGELIFESHDLDKGWNGRFKNDDRTALAQQDVYVCKIIYKDILSKPHHYFGTVTIVK